MKLFWNGLLCGALISMLAGCESKPSAPDGHAEHAAGEEHHDHDHHGLGPNGGTIGEWGAGDYHIEFTVDHGKQEATVYILGGDAKTAKPIQTDKLLLNVNDPSIQVDLLPQPLEGEAEGTSSRFVGQNEAFGKEQTFAGSVTAEIDGTPYTGEFQESAEAHDHDHDHDH